MAGAMRTGIVGFAGSGKTTVFNALTGLAADTGFGNKERTNLGMIKVPDARVELLARIDQPKKKTLAEIAFVDVAGPEAGASESGLDARLVNEMRSVDALVHVVRAFDNASLKRPPDPRRDLEDFEAEMILTDQLQVENRLEKLRKEGKKSRERDLLEAIHAHLDGGAPLRTQALTEQEQNSVTGFHFLSLKPCLALVSQPDDRATAELPPELCQSAGARRLALLTMAGRAEAEIAALTAEEQLAFLADLGLTAPSRDRFVQAVYAHLDLISFLTRGPDECRAWTIRRGTKAKDAAGKIHSDIERGFIRAEVIPFTAWEKHPSEAACREHGLLRVEGKDYVVQDGDIVHFRFNV
jgi:hypothetical protein